MHKYELAEGDLEIRGKAAYAAISAALVELGEDNMQCVLAGLVGYLSTVWQLTGLHKESLLAYVETYYDSLAEIPLSYKFKA